MSGNTRRLPCRSSSVTAALSQLDHRAAEPSLDVLDDQPERRLDLRDLAVAGAAARGENVGPVPLAPHAHLLRYFR